MGGGDCHHHSTTQRKFDRKLSTPRSTGRLVGKTPNIRRSTCGMSPAARRCPHLIGDPRATSSHVVRCQGVPEFLGGPRHWGVQGQQELQGRAEVDPAEPSLQVVPEQQAALQRRRPEPRTTANPELWRNKKRPHTTGRRCVASRTQHKQNVPSPLKTRNHTICGIWQKRWYSEGDV